MTTIHAASKIALLRERDGDVCHLCGLPIWWSAPTTVVETWIGQQSYQSHRHHDCSASLDHIIPVVKHKPGEEYNVSENLRLAHRWCNSRRGHAPVEQFSELAGNDHYFRVRLPLLRAGLVEYEADDIQTLAVMA